MVEERVFKYIENNIDMFSKRFLRFLAMYFPNARVRRECWVKTNVELGQNTYLNLNITVIDDYYSNDVLLKIGDNCSIAPGVVFAPDSNHNNSSYLRKSGLLDKFSKRETIVIGNDVWIGANSTVLPGVKIGDSCIIGANSLVNKDIPDYSLAFGSPIKIIRDLRNPE
jgi:acetyltransferase-like isoleucine patch superfamily enzyme